MTYPVERATGVNPWLHNGRPMRAVELAGVQIHASRSGISDGDDGPRTVRWMSNRANGSPAQGWGSSCDEVIGEDGKRTLITPNYKIEAPTYCAGYGDQGTWSAGSYYYQIEMAQGRIEDDYTDAQIESLAERAKELAAEHGFDANKRILYLTQIGTPPEGICTHQGSANGKKLGKSDPGPNFPWEKFWDYIEEGGDMLIYISTAGAAAIYHFDGSSKQYIAGEAWDVVQRSGAPYKLMEVTDAELAAIPDTTQVPTMHLSADDIEAIATASASGVATATADEIGTRLVREED